MMRVIKSLLEKENLKHFNCGEKLFILLSQTNKIMKWIWKVIKWILGYLYLAWKFIAFIFIGTIYFLWDLKTDTYKEAWIYFFSTFYTSETHGMVWWSYETIEDWIEGNRTY